MEYNYYHPFKPGLKRSMVYTRMFSNKINDHKHKRLGRTFNYRFIEIFAFPAKVYVTIGCIIKLPLRARPLRSLRTPVRRQVSPPGHSGPGRISRAINKTDVENARRLFGGVHGTRVV